MLLIVTLADNLSGLKTIGKAGIAVTKQIGKTLSALGESPDQRGHQKLKKVQYEVHGQSKQEMTNLKTDEIPGIEAGMYAHSYMKIVLLVIILTNITPSRYQHQ